MDYHNSACNQNLEVFMHPIRSQIYVFISIYLNSVHHILDKKYIPHFIQILFRGFMPFLILTNYFLIWYDINIIFPLAPSFAKWICYATFSLAWLSVLAIYITKSSIITRNEELEKFIETYRDDCHKNKCEDCNVTIAMRSMHCPICNKCFAKWEVHSYWFNVCIDAGRQAPYWLFELFSTIFCITNLIVIGVYIQEIYNIHRFPILYFVIFLFYTRLIVTSFWKEFKKIRKNLTQYELMNWPKLPYLWLNKHQAPFNPFDRGTCNNFAQVFIAWCSSRQVVKSKPPAGHEGSPHKNQYQELNQTTEERGDIEMSGLIAQNNPGKTQELEIQAENQPTCKYIVPHDGKFNPNWRIYRIYSIIDILNSPMKNIILAKLQKRKLKKLAKAKKREEKMKRKEHQLMVIEQLRQKQYQTDQENLPQIPMNQPTQTMEKQ